MIPRLGARTLNLAAPISGFPLTYLSGPGLRLAIFVQGCPLRCTEKCLNPDELSMADRVILDVGRVVEDVLAVREQYGIEGVTFLGGEPFAQAAALSTAAAELRAHNLSVMTYSGYGIQALLASDDPGKMALLAETDILVEGPFIVEQMSDRLLWRGSRNQCIFVLSDLYSPEILSERCLQPNSNPLPRPEIRMFDPYFEAIELHYSYLQPLESCQVSHLECRPEIALPEGIQLWCPECAAQQTGHCLARKGVIAMIADEHVTLYGNEDQAGYDRLVMELERLGIRLPI